MYYNLEIILQAVFVLVFAFPFVFPHSVTFESPSQFHQLPVANQLHLDLYSLDVFFLLPRQGNELPLSEDNDKNYKYRKYI